MRILQLCLTAAAVTTSTEAKKCRDFPHSTAPFASGFSQPEPPLIKPEFQASFVQHKWDVDVSNIAAGYVINSPSQGIVRAYISSELGPQSSVFDYANVTAQGLVDNTVITYSDNSAEPTVWRDYVNPNFPIFQDTILRESGAVFAGLVERRLVDSRVAAWNIVYQGAIPVTIYVDSCNNIRGFDYFAPERRTRVITEFFNVQTK